MPDVGDGMEHTNRSESNTSGKPGNRPANQQTSSHTMYNPYFTGRPRTPTGGPKAEPIDRQEIIRKIKEKGLARQQSLEARELLEHGPVHQQYAHGVGEPALLPSPVFGAIRPTASDFTGHDTLSVESASQGLEISRPRSALHRGDFRGEETQPGPHGVADSPRPTSHFPPPDYAATSPPAPWHDGFPNTAVHRARRAFSSALQSPSVGTPRPRAISGASSLSHSFSYQAPTSPLVNQSNAEDIMDELSLTQHTSSHNLDRRRTFSPRSLQGLLSTSDAFNSSPWQSPPPSLRRESTTPYQAHQPRRSISSLYSLPQSPQPGGRRSSGLGSSPLQRAMVGSFEESILRGRMSSTPSRPLDFTAHIGVLGMGDCKPSLKCPPHIIIPFPAVFYSYGHTNTNQDSQPSPYVGQVDLENAAPSRNAKTKRKPKRSANEEPEDAAPDGLPIDESDIARRRRKQKDMRRAGTAFEDPKGAYRIPPKGQLQIIIKNPNKTAVKLFLVPYNVSDMQPGQKTFVRQRSYSAGPIIDLASEQRRSVAAEAIETALFTADSPQDKPVLRYLVHLHICCTAPGRIWLYKSIRVVFANRVPDGKEKLRNETQLPEPRYTAYRPHQPSAAATPLVLPQLDGAVLMDIDAPTFANPESTMSYAVRSQRPDAHILPQHSVYDGLFVHRHTEPIFRFPGLETVTSRPSSRGLSDEQSNHSAGSAQRGGSSHSGGSAEPVQRVKSPKSPLSPLQQRAISPVTDSSEGTGSFTFSRSNSSERLPGTRAESLLSRRLRDLDMRVGSSGQTQSGGANAGNGSQK